MSNLKAKVDELNAMVLKGEILAAFKKFYASNVVMQENSKPPTVGFEANLKREEDFVAKTKWNSAKILSVTVGENSSAIEMEVDYVHSEWGRVQVTQVALQKWRDGKIVSERFFYGA